jgi:hypothetical protein
MSSYNNRNDWSVLVAIARGSTLHFSLSVHSNPKEEKRNLASNRVIVLQIEPLVSEEQK